MRPLFEILLATVTGAVVVVLLLSRKLETEMATSRADFDAALQKYFTDVKAKIQANTDAIAALQAKLDAGEDFQAEMDQVNAADADLQNVAAPPAAPTA